MLVCREGEENDSRMKEWSEGIRIESKMRHPQLMGLNSYLIPTRRFKCEETAMFRSSLMRRLWATKCISWGPDSCHSWETASLEATGIITRAIWKGNRTWAEGSWWWAVARCLGIAEGAANGQLGKTSICLCGKNEKQRIHRQWEFSWGSIEKRVTQGSHSLMIPIK